MTSCHVLLYTAAEIRKFFNKTNFVQKKQIAKTGFAEWPIPPPLYPEVALKVTLVISTNYSILVSRYSPHYVFQNVACYSIKKLKSSDYYGFPTCSALLPNPVHKQCSGKLRSAKKTADSLKI